MAQQGRAQPCDARRKQTSLREAYKKHYTINNGKYKSSLNATKVTTKEASAETFK